MPGFMDRLAARVQKFENPVMVGLDPRAENLPDGIRPADVNDRAAVAKSFENFCCDVIDVVANLVPVVKPQAAFFEQLGPQGMIALDRVIRHARSKQLLVVLDGKRNDIGTTAQAYAQAYLGSNSAWGADALTVSPYLGDDSIEPFVKEATANQAGIFVLVKTSNPGSGFLQDVVVDGQPMYARVARMVEDIANSTRGDAGYGLAGAVVGATYPRQIAELRAIMPSTWFLVPGFGAQGGTARDVADAFDSNGLGAVINNSRGLIFAYQAQPYSQRFGAARWQEAVEAATRDMIEQLQAETTVSRLR